MSKERGKEFLETRSSIEDWSIPARFSDWLSPIEDLSVLKTAFICIKMDKKEELIHLFEKYRGYILELPENWDGYGAPSFNNEILKRVSNLLEKVFQSLWNEMIEISLPLIQPVPDGSVDINWETDKFELLVNIPSEDNKLVNIYGEKIGFPLEEIENRSNYELAILVITHWLKRII